MPRLTEKCRSVLLVLARAPLEGLRPTEIGEACGKEYWQASGWANGPLKTLFSLGMVERPGKAPLYRLTEAGRNSLEERKR